MVKRGAKSDYGRLLALWYSNPSKVLSFNQIVAEATKWGYTKRTIINYLNQLVAEGLLEKTVDIKRQTFYKPSEKLREIRESIDIIKKLTEPNLDFWVLQEHNLGYPLQYLAAQLQIAILRGLRHYALKGDFESFRQIFEMWIDAGFRDAVYKLAEILPKISDDEEYLEWLIDDNIKALSEDFKLVSKAWRKRNIKKQLESYKKKIEKLRQSTSQLVQKPKEGVSE